MRNACILCLLIPLVLAACGDDKPGNEQVCEPNDTRACSCDPGPDGVETCNSSGTGWGECVCPEVDAGDQDADGGTVTDEGPEDAGPNDAGPEDAAIIGDEATVRDRLADLGAAGVDEYVGAVFDTTPEGRDRTRALLRELG